jgi:myo-inositol-1(or 4)-monophosphatase
LPNCAERGEIKGKKPDTRFIVDPLDGTTNFLHGLPHFALTVAVEERGEIIAGVTYAPLTEELFWAKKARART